jgi:hypothetical protein
MGIRTLAFARTANLQFEWKTVSVEFSRYIFTRELFGKRAIDLAVRYWRYQIDD